VLFALLYFGEGGPIGFIWWALPTWLRVQGVDVARITTLTSLLVLPWVCKFLWAPLVDRTRVGRFGIRTWIITAQSLMGLTLLPLVVLDPVKQFNVFAILLLAHAVSAATQDVAVDALALRMVPEAERGRLNGAMQAGMLVGRSLFGGGALILAATLGWPVILVALTACIWASLVAVVLVREPEPPPLPSTRQGFLPAGAGAILRRPTTWLGLIFALLAGAGFEAAGILAGPLLIDRGIDQTSVGWVLGLPVVGATILGGLSGGWLADRWGHTRSVISGIIGFAAMVLVLAAMNGSPATGLAAFAAVLTLLYLCIGLFTASSYALFMDLSRPPLAATQFSGFMAATNGCEAWAAWAGGLLVAGLGYSVALTAMTAVSLISIPVVLRLGNRIRKTT